VLLERAITPRRYSRFNSMGLCSGVASRLSLAVRVKSSTWCKCRQKKVSYPLKGQLTKRDRQPQELNVEPADITQKVTFNTSRTIDVNEQPPAAQLTTNNTLKHNADGHTGWGAKMQGQTKKYYPRHEGGDFLRLAKRTLVSFDNHACNFAIMFWCICTRTCPKCFLFI